MDPAQELLYGRTPRRVGVGTSGVDRQFWVYSTGHMDRVLDSVIGKKNAYATISSFDDCVEPLIDKVSLDFDSPVKETDWGLEEAKALRRDQMFAEDVLGPICDDIQRLGKWLDVNDVPALSVFTGFGVHVHLLYEQRQEQASQAIKSTAHKFIERVGLDHVDHAPVGDVQRIMRIPNAQRIENGERTGTWTVPFTVEEMAEATPEWLIDVSSSPRTVPVPDRDDLPEMEVKQEYLKSDYDQPVESTEVDVDFSDFENEYMKTVMEELLKMPCMYERIVQSNPSHIVRRNCAVLLFNAGLSPEEVFSLFQRLGWRDWDPAVTRYQLKHLYKTGYSDMSCESLKNKGLCVRDSSDDHCSTEGWGGGRAEWKESQLQ